MKRMLAAVLCALCALLPACAAVPEAPEKTASAPEETAARKTPEPIDRPADLEYDAQAVELYAEYLSGQRPARMVQLSQKRGREVSFVPTTFQPPDVFDGGSDPEKPWRVESFSLFSLNGYGTPELILYVTNGSERRTEVLAYYEGAGVCLQEDVYVNQLAESDFCGLRIDGTYTASGGDNTYDFCRASVSNGVMERTPYFPGWEDTDLSDGSSTVNGRSVSKLTCSVWLAMQEGKPLVQRHDWSPGAVEAAFAAEEEARALYREVLEGRRRMEAYAIDDANRPGESWFRARNVYSSTTSYSDTPMDWIVDRFAIMDLDGDGVSELILALRTSEEAEWDDEYAILSCYEGKVVASESVLRGFNVLRADGTFYFSGGLGYSGAARAHFENGVMVSDELIRERMDGWLLNGVKVTEQEYRAAQEIQDAKPEAPWQDMTGEYLADKLGVKERATYAELTDASVTYIASRWGDLLASCEVDGFQLLPNYVRYEYLSEYEDLSYYADHVPQAEDVPRYDPGENTSTPQGRSAALTVASNGDWDLFPDRAVRTTYSLDNQPQRPDWTEYFARRLTEEETESPVIIREVLSFMWDGRQAELVTASNVFITASDSEEDYWGIEVTPAVRAAAHLPAENSRGIYRCTALFLEGDNNPIEIAACWTETLPWCQWLGYPQEPEDALLLSFLSAAELGEDGKLGVYPVFCDFGAELNLRLWGFAPRFLLCDLDGDGQSELVFDQDGGGNLYCNTFIYRPGIVGIITLERTLAGM